MWEASNEALLAGFVTGDPDAAAAFIRRFQRRVFGLARSIVGDPGLDDGQRCADRMDRERQSLRHLGIERSILSRPYEDRPG